MKNIIKSLLLITLAFSMMISLVGCSDNSQPPVVNSDTQSSSGNTQNDADDTQEAPDDEEAARDDDQDEPDEDEDVIPEADLSNLPEIEGVDLLYEIENFNSTFFNTFTLEVDEMHTPTAAVWAQSGSCYTSDESVVTVAKNGNVKGISRGTAYVVIVGSTGMYEVYKYMVE